MHSMETAITNRIKEIAVDLLGVSFDAVTLKSRFREDLEADSLDLVELVMAFEEEFSLEISDEDALRIVTIGEVVAYIKERLSSRFR